MNSSTDCTSHALLIDDFADTNTIEHNNNYYQYFFDHYFFEKKSKKIEKFGKIFENCKDFNHQRNRITNQHK